VIVPWGFVELEKNNKQRQTEFWFAGGLFVLVTIPLSVWDIAMHLRHYENPNLQRYIIRIIWMVPIYSIDAWFGLKFPEAAIYLDTVRELYEAYVIYNFYALLLEFVRQNDPDFLEHAKLRPVRKHMFPLCYVKPWANGEQFFNWIRSGPIVYVSGRILCTLIALITEAKGTYNDGEIKANNPWLWLASINTLTQGWAMYCLILFYYAYKYDLESCRPLPKLLVIKAVVFFSFWQACLVTLLGMTGTIKDVYPFANCTSNATWTDPRPCQPERAGHLASKDAYSTAINDLLICVEMFFAAVAHHYIFSFREFETEEFNAQKMTFRESISHLLTFRDVTEDVVGSLKTASVTAAKGTISAFSKDVESGREGGRNVGTVPLLSPEKVSTYGS